MLTKEQVSELRTLIILLGNAEQQYSDANRALKQATAKVDDMLDRLTEKQ